MSITDELRGFARTFDHVWFKSDGTAIFTTGIPIDADRGDKYMFRIADRIDAEHESEISRAAQLLADAEKDRDFNYANWQDCKQRVLQHNITMNELSAEIERLKDELAHRIELLRDADGEPIHIGDVMEWVPYDDTYRPVIRTVSGVGDDVFFAWSDEKCNYAQYDAQAYRHHKQPTVEDVLREFVDEFNRDDTELCDEEIIERFAAKLRLAESEES